MTPEQKAKLRYLTEVRKEIDRAVKFDDLQSISARHDAAYSGLPTLTSKIKAIRDSCVDLYRHMDDLVLQEGALRKAELAHIQMKSRTERFKDAYYSFQTLSTRSIESLNGDGPFHAKLESYIKRFVDFKYPALLIGGSPVIAKWLVASDPFYLITHQPNEAEILGQFTNEYVARIRSYPYSNSVFTSIEQMPKRQFNLIVLTGIADALSDMEFETVVAECKDLLRMGGHLVIEFEDIELKDDITAMDSFYRTLETIRVVLNNHSLYFDYYESGFNRSFVAARREGSLATAKSKQVLGKILRTQV